MFGAGWTEMLIIGIVALVVIGPKDLPIVMRKIGRVVGTVRRMGGEFQRELNKTTGLDQITDLRRTLTEPLRQTSEEIAKEFNRQTSTGVEPSGAIKPSDPAVESVYDQITAGAGLPAGDAAPVMKPMAAGEVLPAPPEAAALPATKARKAKQPAKKTSAAAPAKLAMAKPAPAKSAAAKAPVEVASEKRKTPVGKALVKKPKVQAASAKGTAAVKPVKPSPVQLANAVPPAPVPEAVAPTPGPAATPARKPAVRNSASIKALAADTPAIKAKPARPAAVRTSSKKS